MTLTPRKPSQLTFCRGVNFSLKMNTEKQKEFLELKTKLLNEIEYREGVLRQLTFDSSREKGFVSTFLKGFLKYKKQSKILYEYLKASLKQKLINSKI